MEEEYKEIEQLYYDFEGDKDAFCKHFVKSGGIQSLLDRRADTILGLKEELRKAAESRKKQEKSLEAEIEKLKEALDKELEWKPCNGGTNMSQTNYEYLLHTSGVELLSESEAKQLIYQEFGFAPEKVTIISAVSTYEANRHHYMREVKSYERVPLYCASDWNYIRFDCAGWMHDGKRLSAAFENFPFGFINSKIFMSINLLSTHIIKKTGRGFYYEVKSGIPPGSENVVH